MSEIDQQAEFAGVDRPEAKREAERVLRAVREFVERNPNFRIAAVIAAAVNDDTGQLYAASRARALNSYTVAE